MKDKEKVKQYNKKYRETHKKYFKDYSKNYRKIHKEDLKIKTPARTIYDREYYKKNKERINKRKKIRKLKTYGLDKKQYDELIISQKGLCAICKKPCKLKKELVIDHDHVTGKFRALLCTRCNISLGNFEDNIEYLQSAIDYLLKHKQ